MKQLIVTHKNGVELSAPLNIGLDESKIVKCYAAGAQGVAPTIIEYMEIDNKRWYPVTYQVNLLQTTVAGLITSASSILTEKNLQAFNVDINNDFVTDMVEGEAPFSGPDDIVSGIDIKLGKGSAGFEKIFAFGSDLDTLIGTVVVDP